MATDVTCRTKGIFYREHDTRKHGRQKDRYYAIRYTTDKKPEEEGLGLASEGWTEVKVSEILTGIKANIRLGKHPQSLKEMREINQKAVAEEKQEAIENGSGVLFSDVFNKYIEQVKIDTLKKTYEARQDRYRIYIEPFIQNKTMSEIKKQDIEDIKMNMLKKNRADDTIKKTIAIVSQVYKYAMEHEIYIGANPADNVKVKCKDNRRTRFLTHEEARLLLDEFKLHSEQVYDIACMALYTGLRAGEIRNMTWECIQWNANKLCAKWRKNGENDLIPMRPELRSMLEKRYAKRDKQSIYIFIANDGNKLRSISRTFSKCVEKLGLNNGITDDLNKVVFHTLRHTYASWLVMNGVDLYTTQKLMGHKSNQMTQRYSHLAPGHLEKAISKLPTI